MPLAETLLAPPLAEESVHRRQHDIHGQALAHARYLTRPISPVSIRATWKRSAARMTIGSSAAVSARLLPAESSAFGWRRA